MSRFKIHRFCAVSALALMAAGAAQAASFHFTYTGATQTGKVAATGIYSLSIAGAAGGMAQYTAQPGGLGALLGGTIELRAGTPFTVLVGGDGQGAYDSGGGGGLSFFDLDSDSVFEAVAGGGGGGSYYGAGAPGLAGTGGGTPYYGGAGGTGGAGGAAASFGDQGAGGAGLLSAGQDSAYSGTGGGLSGAGGWLGGTGAYGGGDGGFGGGAGGTSYAGGGGGGFSGGGGSSGIYGGGGGGGGSYLSTAFSDRMLSSGGATSGAHVTLTFVEPTVIPTPGAFGLMAASLLAMGAVARRRGRG